MRLFLTGFMGSGKSEVGKRVAAGLGLSFVDLDACVEALGGGTIREIVARGGETELRRLESEALHQTEHQDGVVVATGGGVVTRDENRTWMRRRGRVVWLNAPFEVLLDRLDEEARRRRPFFGDEEMARNLLQSRITLYRECDHEIAVRKDDSIDAVAQRVMAWYAETP